MDKRILGLALLVIGAVLLYFGLHATDAPVEHARETLTGNYSDRTMFYLIAGAAAGIVGLALLALGVKR